MLGHVAVASLVSILFVGWMLLAGGILLAVSALVGWKDPAHRWDLASGAVLVLLGIGFVRNPGVGLLVLTLLAGSLLMLGGVVRLVAAFQDGSPRTILVVNGVVTILLGLLILAQWPVSAVWFLGTILGVQLVLDGLTVALLGRIRFVARRRDARPGLNRLRAGRGVAPPTPRRDGCRPRACGRWPAGGS